MKTNLRDKFCKECNYDFGDDGESVASKFSKKHEKWVSIPKGQAWKDYAQWLEDRLNNYGKVQIGQSYSSRGRGMGTVEMFIAQMGMFSVKYEDGTSELVNSHGLATKRDNVMPNEYDLIINNEKNA